MDEGKTKKQADWLNFGKERYFYEDLAGKRLSDSAWWLVRKNLKKMGLPLDEKQLTIYYNTSEVFNLRMTGLAENYEAIISYGFSSNNKWTGTDFKNYLFSLDLLPKNLSTFTRWFKDVGGYKKDKIYTNAELFTILSKAVIYKSKKVNGR